jgi:hypothetical protein
MTSNLSVAGQSCPTRQVFLSWQKQGLQYTSSGYGSKIPSSKQIFYANRWRRVYVTCFSNSGSTWVQVGGQKLRVEDA